MGRCQIPPSHYSSSSSSEFTSQRVEGWMGEVEREGGGASRRRREGKFGRERGKADLAPLRVE